MNLSKTKVSFKTKNFKCGTKIVLLVYFWTSVYKTIVMFKIYTLKYEELPSFIKNKKTLKLVIGKRYVRKEVNSLMAFLH